MLGTLRKLKRAILPPAKVRLLTTTYPEEAVGAHSYGDLKIARYGDDTSFRIGKYCSLATNVTLMLGGGHRPDWVTTYPFSVTDPEFSHIEGHPSSKGDIIIGNDVWIGRDAMIMSGVTIGDGAVVAARALVTHDVPPYCIVAGQPAKPLRYRFPEEIIEQLLAIKWWDWPHERVRKAVPLLLQDDIKAFIAAEASGEI